MFITLFLVAVSCFSLYGEGPYDENTHVIVPELNGIVFYGDQKCVDLEGELSYKGVRAENICIPGETLLCNKMRRFLNKPVTLDLVQEIKNEVIKHYKCHYYPLILVTTPSGQDITTGVLRFVIMKGKLGKIKACGAKYYCNEDLIYQIRTKPGQEIDFHCMMQDLNWINRNPFRQTDVIYSPGEDVGYTDVTLQTCDSKPFKIFGGYENTGNIIAGNSRFFGGFDLGNLFFSEHQLRYLVMMSRQPDKWFAHTATYTAPLRWRNILELHGSYDRALPTPDDDTDLKGRGWNVSGRYIIPINFYILETEFYFGYVFKRTNNFLNFATNEIFAQDFDISEFILSYESKCSYFCGQTATGLKLFLSPGGMTAFNTTELFSELRPGAKASYVYAEAYFDQYLEFFKGYSWLMNLKFQLSSTKLLPSEQFSLGGFYTIRGYDENEVIGDNGVLIKNELRTRCWKLSKNFLGTIQFLAFLDFGVLGDADRSIVDQSSEVLASIGPGLRYHVGDNVQVRVDYGYKLNNNIDRLVDDSDNVGRFHIAATLAF